MESSAIQSVETIEFPCEEWFVVRSAVGEMVSVRPVPGSWTLLAIEDQQTFAKNGQDVKAMFACPRCNQVGFIPSTFEHQKDKGDAKLPSELHCCKCKLTCRVILKDWDKRRLYCACFETLDKNQNILTHKHYLHAEDEVEAKKFFWAQYGREVIRLVGIAPVIGFFVPNPKDDRILVV